MATKQQPKRPNQRMSSGKDILSRMLLMEKQSKHQRASSVSPTHQLSPKADNFSDPTLRKSPSPTNNQRSPLAETHPALRPAELPRSQTSPNLTSTISPSREPKPNEKPKPLTINTGKGPMEPKAGEICLSPSWSDHGEKARKKEERRQHKEQQAHDTKSVPGKERQEGADGKAGKRLSKKPPPAAMETQKMPTALQGSRRNSWISLMSSNQTPREDAGRTSREEKRSSGISLSSFKSKRSRSQSGDSQESTPEKSSPEQWRSIVSPSAPKLPSFRWGNSRRKSTDSAKPTLTGNDDGHEKDFVAFSYRLDPSPTTNDPVKIDLPNLKHSSRPESPKKASNAVAHSNDSPEHDFKSVPYEAASTGIPPESPKKRGTHLSRQEKTNEQRHPKPPPPDIMKKGPLSPPPVGPGQQIMTSYDGGSYVHKQRMYQQQQCIAGFEDQQAVKDATELASGLAQAFKALEERTAAQRGRSSVPSSPIKPLQSPAASPARASKHHSRTGSESSIYTKQRDRSTSPSARAMPPKHQPAGPTPLSQETRQSPGPEEEQKVKPQLNAQVSPQRRGDDSVILTKPQDSSKTGIFNFRRRSKQPPAVVAVPYAAETNVQAIQSTPLGKKPAKASGLKQAQTENILTGSKPMYVESRDKRSSSTSSQKRVEELMTKPNSKRSHSRNRTSSSAVLNDNLVPPMPASKPIAQSAMTSNKKSVEGLSRVKDDHQMNIRPMFSFEDEPEELIRKIPNVVTGPKVKETSKPNAQANSKAQPPGGSSAARDDIPTSLKKPSKEVVVKSQTAEGLVHKTSITRPRSNPQLQSTALTTTTSGPSADFLPPLKHQPLVRKDPQPPIPTTPPISIVQFQSTPTSISYESPSPPDLKLIPRSPLRAPSQFPVPSRFNRSSTDIIGRSPLSSESAAQGQPVAKLFVICCKCKFWHDLPSKLYEAMALPLELHKAEKGKVAGARLDTAVKCPWCDHGMRTECCQGWTTVVYLHERHH